jgi:hypothetical protein
MANQIRQYYPFCVDLEPEVREFNTFEELMEIPFVKHWREDKNFDCFSLENGTLICISKKGTCWWLVGYILHPEKIDISAVEFDEENNRYKIPQ